MLTDHNNYNCVVKTATGETYKIYANYLHNEGIDNWRGWQCEAGYVRIYINDVQDVYSGQCLNQNLGNLNTTWNLNTQATPCNRDTCTGCTDDLITAKRKNT